MKRILLIGNVPSSAPKSIGGANTYTYEILSELKERKNIIVEFLPIRNRWYKGGQFMDYLTLMFKAPFKITKFDVISIHASLDFHTTIGPFLVLFSRFKKKRIVYHFFGGYFHEMYSKFPRVFKFWLDNTIFKSDYKLVETKRMISFFTKTSINKGFIWFPNTRKCVIEKPKRKPFSKNFVFISRVTPTKGVDFIIDVAKKLDTSYNLDLFGPLETNYYTEETFENTNVNYKGVLHPSEVISTLNNYDVLILPTFYKGEGYPGIFIEAMSLGKPIISTNWNALDELVIDGINGRLIEIKSAIQLKEAIESFNENNYEFFSRNSLEQFSKFNLNNAIDKLLKLYLE